MSAGFMTLRESWCSRLENDQ